MQTEQETLPKYTLSWVHRAATGEKVKEEADLEFIGHVTQ